MAGEERITNLGPVPTGMTFLEATIAARPQRKFEVNYYQKGTRLTICDTLRHMWRETDKLPDSESREIIREYIAASVDYAKRMDARMKELKAKIDA